MDRRILHCWSSLGAALRTMCLPWVVAGDWNMQPAMLQAAGFFHEARGILAAQTDAVEKGTCFTGVGAEPSYYDYILCHFDVVPYVCSDGFQSAAPFGMHGAVKILMAWKPAEALAPHTKQIKPLPPKTVGTAFGSETKSAGRSCLLT